MSKTTPVRWWRDDATRYQKRSPHEASWGGPGKWGNGYDADVAYETEWQEARYGKPWLRIASDISPNPGSWGVPPNPLGDFVRGVRAFMGPSMEVRFSWLACYDPRHNIHRMCTWVGETESVVVTGLPERFVANAPMTFVLPPSAEVYGVASHEDGARRAIELGGVHFIRFKTVCP